MSKVPKQTKRLNSVGVTQLTFNGKYTRAKIENIAQQYSNALNKYGAKAKIEVVMAYPSYQFRSGIFTKVGEPVSLFDPHEYDGAPVPDVDSFKRFYLFIHKNNEKAGGCDGEWNNCLYYCLKDMYPDKVTKVFKKAHKLKRFLKIDDDSKISLKLIPKIEEKLNIRIQVKGDHSHISTCKASREVNLILSNGHYKLDKEGAFKVKGIAQKSYANDRMMKPVAYKWCDEDVKTYDGKEYSTMSKEEFIKEKSTLKYKSDIQFIKIQSDMSLKETLQSFIKDADQCLRPSSDIRQTETE
ncbi:hypothetical protein SAMD00019534_125530 [Acytostelium subglobosum LB1]|uniref:hypothetical protein n=1 Tax=Acytostelium subglobosum LB1 TaxID=1410327 RepID=UPI000644BF3E|nr:hypothetical protein SAMD00019534_125530 [Acytostelium subglobosum LB1]GAM29377.1 hypothetical protein SAMD00019534_125530 [Acytostelium subglobosum LB1]|eukprot:XP_012747682.1 hypothetical protein SAMD00019534_125530 [Acytostelium subglobosum LB1]